MDVVLPHNAKTHGILLVLFDSAFIAWDYGTLCLGIWICGRHGRALKIFLILFKHS